MPKRKPTQNVVVISDLHCGCQMGLCPPEGARMDEGGHYQPSAFQEGVWAWWLEFWEWVDKTTHGEPFDLVVNGDAMDGVHHGSTHQFTHNPADQRRVAYEILAPVVERAERYYHIRGTEAHVGQSGTEEETLAESLGAVPNEVGQFARYDLWKLLGKGRLLLHIAHHIGSTGSQHYESTAVLRELVEAYVEAGRWHGRPPDCVIRSHRHRSILVQVPTANQWGMSVVTPAWQGKTPFAWKLAGARQAEPQFGGVLIREAPDGVWYAAPWVRSLSKPEPEV